ncbi:hypothetical protein [Ruegeria sp. HKCCE3926]|uniref:hypothetical protein n=1 Tax=Ruegeria sp. HKCCE3926 TaxID=2794831 RepID=UPI001AE754C2|nr:hypothetical protein [Ruegeria sp. HKCCE3926]
MADQENTLGVLPGRNLGIPMNVQNAELIQVLKADLSHGTSVFGNPFGRRTVGTTPNAIFAPALNYLFFH